MPKYDRFDKSAAIRLRKELEDYLKPFLEERGISIKLGNAKYNDNTIRFVGPEFHIGDVSSPEKTGEFLRQNLVVHGVISYGDSRNVFESKEYILVDYRPKAWKRPWVAKSKFDGKNYVLSNEQARVHFGAKA